jgi:hypothetical protein
VVQAPWPDHPPPSGYQGSARVEEMVKVPEAAAAVVVMEEEVVVWVWFLAGPRTLPLAHR